MNQVSLLRRRALNAEPIHADGAFVLYWMNAARRCGWNHGLEHAADWARRLARPLVILETLSCDYPWANLRLHRFALQGMADNARQLATKPVIYHPFVEDRRGQIPALLREWGGAACLVVTDEFPLRWHRQLLAQTAGDVAVRYEAVDSCGLLPLRAAEHDFPSAYAFRRFLQRELLPHLLSPPAADPLDEAGLAVSDPLPAALAENWPAAAATLLAGDERAMASLPIDQQIPPVATRGGADAADQLLEGFLGQGLDAYQSLRNQPQAAATSGLSAHLRWGHISSHEIVLRLLTREQWSPDRLAPDSRGRRSGWWGLSGNAEAFLDQLVTWRELGNNYTQHHDDYDRFDALPPWARQTLQKHSRDPRPELYSPEALASGRTADALWSAAQGQLLREGQIHNYLRMLWGKKILEWSPDPHQALEVMIDLNNRLALDGGDPNSYSGIGWCLGRFDRPWGPERPIFGTVRYMSSRNTARKVAVDRYIEEYAVDREAP